MGVQVFLSQLDNAVPAATLTASSVLPGPGAVTPGPRAWRGRGTVSVSGVYSGADSGTVEVEVLDIDATAHPLVSALSFVGVGNGTLSDASVATAQTVTVTLASLGEQLKSAGINLGPVVVRARQPGAAGKSITLTVDSSALVYTLANFST